MLVSVSVEEIVSLRWEDQENSRKCEELSLGEFTLRFTLDIPRTILNHLLKEAVGHLEERSVQQLKSNSFGVRQASPECH